MIIPAMMPRSRMRLMISSSSGWSSGSPPLIVTIVGPEIRQQVHAPAHRVDRDGLREIVVLVTVRARQVAAANRDQMRHDRAVRVAECVREHASLPKPSLDPAHAPADCNRAHLVRLYASGM